MGIIGRVSSLQQSRQALIFERDTQNEPLGVAAWQIRQRSPGVRPRVLDIVSLRSRSRSHSTGHRRPRASGGRMHTSGAHVVRLKPELGSYEIRAAGDRPATLPRACATHSPTPPSVSPFAHTIAGHLRQPEPITCHRNGLVVPRLSPRFPASPWIETARHASLTRCISSAGSVHFLARSRYEARISELLPNASRSASVAISRHLAMRCSRERLMKPPASNSRMIVEFFIVVRPTADTCFSFRVAFASTATFVLVHSRQHSRKVGASISRFSAHSSSRHSLALPLSQRDGFES